MFFHLDFCAVLNRLCFGWSVLGFRWCGMLVFVEGLFDESWHMGVEDAVVVVPFELDADVELPFPVDCDVVPLFEGLNKMVSVSVTFHFDAEIVHY